MKPLLAPPLPGCRSEIGRVCAVTFLFLLEGKEGIAWRPGSRVVRRRYVRPSTRVLLCDTAVEEVGRAEVAGQKLASSVVRG